MTRGRTDANQRTRFWPVSWVGEDGARARLPFGRSWPLRAIEAGENPPSDHLSIPVLGETSDPFVRPVLTPARMPVLGSASTHRNHLRRIW